MTLDSPPDSKVVQRVTKSIIRWFESHGRPFGWRATSDPFSVLMAEMLLRRTTASAVSRVYSTFMQHYPSPADLASSSESELGKILDSLGLQSIRTRYLLEAGRILVTQYGGVVPRDYDSLISLPGLGRYGASAVTNFAFGIPVPLVDGNVLHFVSRVFSRKYSGPDDEEAWRFMSRLGGRKQDRRLYWGIIDLVATVCHRSNPHCESCPVNRTCDYCGSAQARVCSPDRAGT